MGKLLQKWAISQNEAADTAFWASIPTVLSLVIMWVTQFADKKSGPASPLQKSDYLYVSVIFFLWSCSFLICAWRKELPQLITIRGLPAVIFGLIGFLGCLAFAAFFLLSALRLR